MKEKKPFIQITYNNHNIVINNTIRKCILIIDGEEVDSYKGIIAGTFRLNGNIGEDTIKAEFKLNLYGGTMYVYYNEKLIAKKYHI